MAIYIEVQNITNVQTHQSRRCSHTQNMDVDEDSNQNIDLLTAKGPGLRANDGPTLNACLVVL